MFAVCRLLVVGCCVLCAVCLFVVRWYVVCHVLVCSLCVARCVLFVVGCCMTVAVCRLLSVGRCGLLAVCCLFWVCLLCNGWCLPCAVCCWLSGVLRIVWCSARCLLCDC